MQQLNGIRVPLLLKDGIPEPMSAAYTVSALKTEKALNTIDTYLRPIIILYRWCDQEPINFHQRMASLEGFSASEITELANECKKNFREEDSARGSTYKKRITTIKAFTLHWFDFFLNRAKSDKTRFSNGRYVRELMKLKFETLQSVPGTKSETKKGLSPELKEKFIEIINPLNEKGLNPWRSEKIRWRNYVLLCTYILSGARRGEGLLLETVDYYLDGPDPKFAMKHRDRPVYPRAQQPARKTRGKNVGISKGFAEVIRYYLTDIRTQFKNAHKNTHMFLSGKDGGPISLGTVNAITNSIKEKYPEFKGHLSPHRLRNTFHDALEKALHENPLSKNEIINQSKKQAVQTYAGTWEPNSKMPKGYTEGERERMTNEITRKIQKNTVIDINNKIDHRKKTRKTKGIKQ